MDVFLCYRRTDSEGYALLLEKELAKKGVDVFRDGTDIRPGEDIPARISKAILGSAGVLVLIGPYWLSSLKERQQDNDFVRREISLAIQHRKRILPLVLGSASIPNSDDLPQDLRPLARIRYLKLDSEQSEATVEKIAIWLDSLKRRKQKRKLPPQRLREEWDSLMSQTHAVLALITEDPFSSAPHEKALPLAAAWEEFARRVKQPLYHSQALVNGGVVLAEAGLVECSTAFAARHDADSMIEPYKTQLQVLPAHACFHRYEEATKLLSVDLGGDRRRWTEKVASDLGHSMQHLAARAYERNPDHAHAAYVHMVSLLIVAKVVGDDATRAVAAASVLPWPEETNDPAELRYHLLGLREFERIQGTLFPEQRDILTALDDRARLARFFGGRDW